MPATIVWTVAIEMINDDNSGVIGTALAKAVLDTFGLQAAVLFRGVTPLSVEDTIATEPVYMAPMGMSITNRWLINMSGNTNEAA